MQNNKRYWLRGGLIGILGISIVSIILTFFGIVLGSNPFWIIAEDIASPLYTCNGICIGEGLMFTIPVFIIETFIVGVILGWIYQKIKNSKKAI